MAKAGKGCVDDLATLSELNEDIILQELQARYHKDVIYVRKWMTRNERRFARIQCVVIWLIFTFLLFVNSVVCLNIFRHMSEIF